MDSSALIGRLERFAGVLPAVTAVVTDAEARWKPAAEHWSILEVCRHLLDEEREDFRPRLESTLRDPAAPWAKLQLEGIAERLKYNEADLKETVVAWTAERRKSIAWLRTLAAPDWARAYQHPSGAVRAGDLLGSWAAHDALHLRQISKRLFELAARDAGEFKTGYAGAW
jgi:hypothetical protein